MKSIMIIMRLTLREAARRKVLWGLLVLGGLFLILYAIGLLLIIPEIPRSSPRALERIGGVNTIYNFFLMAALYAANFLIIMTDQHRFDALGCAGNPDVRAHDYADLYPENRTRLASHPRRSERYRNPARQHRHVPGLSHLPRARSCRRRS